ncbi:hypothetical protein IJZ97_00205 [bacterium]|nr:hypothetical protein [bacterium]
MSGNEINIGGVTYQPEHVKHHSESTTKQIDNSGNISIHTTYNVELNDGTTLTYGQQNLDRKASVFQKENETQFFGLSNAKITDTPKEDVYKLFGCEFTTVDANREEEEKVKLPGSFRHSNYKLNVSTDSDTIIFENRVMPNGEIQKEKSAKYVNVSSVPSFDWKVDHLKTSIENDYSSTHVKLHEVSVESSLVRRAELRAKGVEIKPIKPKKENMNEKLNNLNKLIDKFK